VPSPRSDAPRSVPPVQFDLTARQQAAYQRALRARKARADAYPDGATPRRGGWPVTARKGLPERINYPLGRNTRAKSMTEAEAARHLGADCA